MQPQDWHRAKELFQSLLDLPPDRRLAGLEGEPDEAIRREVIRLLEQSDGAGSSFLCSPLGQSQGEAADGLLTGQQIGEFLLEERIGSGGHGAVYAATQITLQRRAAVKIAPAGNHSPRSLRRFEHEAEILARLRHPGLAPVYAVGIHQTAEGARPWFAMELVDGLPLQRFLQSHPLPVRERLELLLGVCDAVHHVHLQGVVHRDLKPSNILVESLTASPQDSAPRDERAAWRTRVVDFGVARVLEGDSSASLLTHPGDLFGTLAYMSPEQFLGDPRLVGPPADVWALGAIAFEMLAGRLPHDRGQQNLLTLLRGIDRERLRPLRDFVPGLPLDLELIVARATDPDPGQRYATAEEFACDLRRFLAHEPVRARRPTLWYRSGKFLRRNRLAVAGTLAILVALTAGLVLYALEARRARRAASESLYEANKAMAVNNFITNDFLMRVLSAAAGDDAAGPLPVAGIVDAAASNVAGMYAGRPLEEAAVRNELGTIYYNLGAWDRALEQFQQAWSIWKTRLGEDHPDALKGANNTGQTLMHLGQLDEAGPILRECLQARQRVLGLDHEQTLATLNNLAGLTRAAKRPEEAEQLFRDAVERMTRSLGAGHKSTLTAQGNLASLLAGQGRGAEALAIHQSVHAAAVRVFGTDHVFALNTGIWLAQSLHREGRSAEAEVLLAPVSRRLATTVGPAHEDSITALRLLARIYRSLGNADAARSALESALAGALEATPPQPELVNKVRRELQRLASGPAD